MKRIRMRRRRVALAASILIPLVGTGGYAAYNMTKGSAARSTEAVGSKPISVAIERPVDREHAAPKTSLVAMHPVSPTTFTLRDRGSVLPVLPKDPFRPFAHFEWYYVVPSHVIDRKFDPETRELDFLLNQDVAVAAKLQAREEIATAYRANGHPDVTAEQISLQPLQRVGYAISLKYGQGDLLLKKHDGFVLTGETMPVSGKIPPDKLKLIDQLVRKPNYVTAVHSGLYRFELSQQASTEVKGLRASVVKAIEKVFGKGGIPAGGVIIDRRTKDDFLATMRDELTVMHREMGMEVDAITDRALKHLDDMKPLTFEEFLDRPEGTKIYTGGLARREMKPEEYDLLTKKTEDLIKQQAKLETTAKTVSDLAKHELRDREFYRKVQEALSGSGEVEVDVMVFFQGATRIDFSKAYEDQVREKSTAISDLRTHALNESALKSELLNESYKRFEGHNHRVGSTPKGWDLFLVDDSRIVGDTLFADYRVRVVGLDTVAIDEEFSLEVVSNISNPNPGPTPEIKEFIAASKAKQATFEDALRSQDRTIRELQSLVATQKRDIGTLTHDLEAAASSAIRAEWGNWGVLDEDDKTLFHLTMTTPAADSKGRLFKSKFIKFAKPFRSPPMILTSVSNLATGTADQTIRYAVNADDITKEGFSIRMETFASSSILNVWVKWLAVGN